MSGTSVWLLSETWYYFGEKYNNFLDILLERELAKQNYVRCENILGFNM